MLTLKHGLLLALIITRWSTSNDDNLISALSLSLSFFGLVGLICVYLSLWEKLDLFQEPVSALPVHNAVMSGTGPEVVG